MDQQQRGETPVVSVSGNSSEVLVVEARDRGFQVHVLVNLEHKRHGCQVHNPERDETSRTVPEHLFDAG